MKPDRMPTKLLAWLRWAPLVALIAALPCQAQYKVVGSDGKVTYTDRPPVPGQGKVTALGPGGVSSAAGDLNLPLELRQPVARYPVTLYALSGACDTCDSARQLLRQRGVPFNEKQVTSPEDTEALLRLSGSREVPTLSIGSQTLRGLATDVWNSYLDAAGYPRESRLPANYQYPAPTPLTEKREASVVRAPAARASQPSAAEITPAAPPSPSGIKF